MSLVLAAAAAPAGAFVYFANDTNDSGTTIGRANLDGTGVNQSFISGASGPHNVAVDSAHIYWADCAGLGCAGTTVGRANLDGTGVNDSFITGASGASGVAVDGAHIYWANISNGTIGRANIDGTGVDQSFITGASNPHSVAVDGAHIYWSNFGGTTIGRANLDGMGVNQSFIAGASLPTGVAVDGVHIYWANFGSGASGTTIGRANLDGMGVDQGFITGASAPNGLAVDSSHIYWGNCADASCSGTTIGRANLDGTGINQSFIGGAGGPSGLAVDSLAQPSNTSPPAISGTAAVGQTLTCSNGSWTGNPTSFTYQWNRDGAPISGATGQTYVAQAADQGHALTCTVVASNAGSSSSPVRSGGVAVAAPGPPPAPNPIPPSMSGIPAPAHMLTAPNCTITSSGKVAIKKRKVHGRASIAAGTLPVRVTCDQAVTARLDAQLADIPRAKAHGRKPKTKRYKLAAINARLAAGATTLNLKLPASAMNDLVHGATESVTITLAGRNANGNSRATDRIAPLRT